jgi:hypothetical protein
MVNWLSAGFSVERCINGIYKSRAMTSQNQENPTLPKGTMLYRFNEVPIVAQPAFWLVPVLLTGLLAWVAGLRKPERSCLQRLGVGLLATLVATFADIGHAMAHTISARLAGAPMDEIFLSSGMPRTLYENDAVPPQTHIRRSLGGPIFSLIGFTLSLLWRGFSPNGSLSHDLADASLAGHSFILIGSLAPLPMVDGGIILKWKLVEGGQSPEQADQMVRKTSLSLGAAFLGLGALLGLLQKRKLVAGILAAGGAAGVAAGIGWLK